jgi:spore germination protein YaaH
MKQFAFLISLIFPVTLLAQQSVSIHQEQLEHYNNLGVTAAQYETQNQPKAKVKKARGSCTLNKVVYGWHPYWSNGLEANYDWSLLTDFSYFSYEVDAATGNALTTHGWSTAQSVTDALNNGKRVTLCVTLFSGHSTFFGSSTAQQTLISNLISDVQARGAHGVNIDFEGIPASQKTNFTNFMIDLCNQMHAAIPGSNVSTVLYSVDWNDVFDIAALDPYVDLFVVMGYGYYYSGSSTAGPTDPLFHFGTNYNYTLSKTITYYLDQGITPSKLIMGLPYYGREWPVASTGIPAATTGSGSARTYTVVKTNTSGNYSAANTHWDNESFTTYFEFNSGGTRQCFIDSKYDMGKRLEVINQRDIGGMGVWALGYDDGYNDYWDEIYDKFTDCGINTCTDTVYDVGGGPLKNYYDDEDYTFTIQPDNATSVTLNFSSFDVESNFDYLYIFDGPDTSATPFPGSPFTGTTIPGPFTSTGNSITLRFTSDGATVNPGFSATYSCALDSIPPTTQVNLANNWETTDFTATFTDTDNNGGTGIDTSFYLVSDYDGNEWRSNHQNGFFTDNFDTAIHPEWTSATGSWAINNSSINQSDENESNSNIYALLTQSSSEIYLYHWNAIMDGTGTNRRSGIHFFSDDGSLPNRGNSYFVYYRADTDKCQIYKVVNDAWTLMTDDDFTIQPATWYDFKIAFDPSTGTIKAFVNDTLASQWTDPSPHASGNYISLRSGGTDVHFEKLKVYKSRTASELVTVGNATSNARYQNFGPTNNACQVTSITIDKANNWSTPSGTGQNIDWTVPGDVVVNDGIAADVNIFYTPTEISANWAASIEPNSGIAHYWYAIGTTPGDTNVVAWTSNASNTSVTHTGLSLINGQDYYYSVVVENGAGLFSDTTISDGQVLVDVTSIAENETLQINAFPNPIGNVLYLQLSQAVSPLTIQLVDITGKVLFQQLLNTNSPNITVELEHLQLAKGYYILQVSTEKTQQQVKLFKK